MERVARLRGLQRTHMRRVQAVSSGVTGDLTAMGLLVDEELLQAPPSSHLPPQLSHQHSFDYVNGWRPLSPQPRPGSSLDRRRMSPSTQPLRMEPSTASLSSSTISSTAADFPTRRQTDSDDTTVHPPHPHPTSALTAAAAVSERQPMRSRQTEEERKPPSGGANNHIHPPPPGTARTLSPLVVPVRRLPHSLCPSLCPPSVCADALSSGRRVAADERRRCRRCRRMMRMYS